MPACGRVLCHVSWTVECLSTFSDLSYGLMHSACPEMCFGEMISGVFAFHLSGDDTVGWIKKERKEGREGVREWREVTDKTC